MSQGDRGFDGLPGLPGDKGHRVSGKNKSVACPFSKLTVVCLGLVGLLWSVVFTGLYEVSFYVSRVTQDQWDLQDLKERMEKGYKASADTDYKVILGKAKI